MVKRFKFILFLLLVSASGGCNKSEKTEEDQPLDGGYIPSGMDASHMRDSGMDADADSDTDADSDADAGGDADADADADIVGDASTWMIKLDGDSYYYSVIETSSRDLVAAGMTNVFGFGDFDARMVRITSEAEIIWQKAMGGPSRDCASFIAETSDKGFVFAGYTESFGAGNRDIWVVKLDGSGNPVWQKTLGGKEDDEAYEVIESSDRGIVIAAGTWSFGAGDSDMWMIKLDADGEVLWQQTIGGDEEEKALAVIETSENELLFSGYSDSAVYDIPLVKLALDGSIIWIMRTVNTEAGTAHSIYETSDHNLLLAGSIRSGSYDPEDMLLMMMDLNADIIWQKILKIPWDGDHPPEEWGFCIAEGPDNDLYLGADWVQTEMESSGAGNYLLCMDEQGELKWSKHTKSISHIGSVAWTHENRIIFSGGNNIVKTDMNGNIEDGCLLIENLDDLEISTGLADFEEADFETKQTGEVPADSDAGIKDTPAITQFVCPE